MQYNNRLPQNSTGYIVGNRAFAGLRQAEIYCNDNDFDVDIIELDLDTAKVISSANIAAFDMLLETMEKYYNDCSDQVDRQSDKLDKLRESKARMSSIDIELAVNKLMELNNTRSGYGEAMKLIRNQRLSSMGILRA